jgi:hypothetical protein
MKFFLLTLALLSKAFSEDVELLSITLKEDGSFNLAEGVFEAEGKYIAGAKFTKSIQFKGFDLLAIKTNFAFDDTIQAEAAGYLEGYLTNNRIWSHYSNIKQRIFGNNPFPDNAKEFMEKHERFIEDSFKEKPSDPVIYNSYLILKQLHGMRNAYNFIAQPEKKIDNNEFHYIDSTGDMLDIIYYKNTQARPNFKEMSVESIVEYFHTTNHCSSLFKVKDDFSDIFFGHNTWLFYSAMTRLVKEYNFNFNNPAIKARNIIFTSFPATLASTDDFYITSQDLAITETTNSIFNNKLYEKLNPNTLLTWERAMIANRLSVTSKEWAENFVQHNSGTYNNQFMILDMKQVDLDNKVINNEAMYIVEQIPGAFEINDITEMLRYGYWPSYNVPYSKEIFKLSGYEELIQQKPALKASVDYSTCARSNIFRREQSTITDVDSYKRLIRFNNYKKDPLSLGKPANAIAARSDLEYSCFGAIDAKVSSVKDARGSKKKIHIIAGPTNEQQSVFRWDNSESCKNDPRLGIPMEFDFGWFEYKSEFEIDDSKKQKDYLKLTLIE